MANPKIYIGTAGWSYQDWVGSFYPKSQSRDFNWLEYYSHYFNTVEVNSTYYTYLSPKIIDGWLEQIEHIDDFLFIIKLHMDFTHKHSFNKEHIDAIKINLDKLARAERLGGLLLQFPYSFGFNDANVEYLRKLIEIFDVYKKYVEVRHKSWEKKKAKTVTFCSIDQPQIGQAISFNTIAGNKCAYVRLHGRNEEAWKESLEAFGKQQNYQQRSSRYDYLYTPGEIVEIAQNIREVYDEVEKIFVILNNHPHGNAPANAFEIFHHLIDDCKINIPQTVLESYPRLKPFSLN